MQKKNFLERLFKESLSIIGRYRFQLCYNIGAQRYRSVQTFSNLLLFKIINQKAGGKAVPCAYRGINGYVQTLAIVILFGKFICNLSCHIVLVGIHNLDIDYITGI